jgi:phospholipid transport system substrate-binding protein
MFTNTVSAAARAATDAAATGLSRRSLLGMAMMAAVAPMLTPRAYAAGAPAEAVTTINTFNAALQSAMKAGKTTPFDRRFATLGPAVDQAFDLPSVLATSVGPRWATLPPDQQSRLLDAFRRYTVASYVANFDTYNGQVFTISPDTRSTGPTEVVVQTHIQPASGEPTDLGYVMRQTPAGWKIVDVLASGSISRVAVQRSDFRGVLARGGGDALVASLQRKTSDLSGGALA